MDKNQLKLQLINLMLKIEDEQLLQSIKRLLEANLPESDLVSLSDLLNSDASSDDDTLSLQNDIDEIFNP
jgi:hypothetical protein